MYMEPIEFFVENKTLFAVFHVLSVVLGMGSALVSDILFTFFAKDKTLHESERRVLGILSKFVWYALIIIVLSGFAMFFSNPDKYEHSQKFISKMIIMGVLLLNGFVLHKLVQPHLADKGILRFKNKQNLRRVAFAGGAVSLISWTTICVLGVLSSIPWSFKTFVIAYSIFTFCAVCVALFVESKTFKHN